MTDWQSLRELYDQIETPMALYRFYRRLYEEAIEENPRIPDDVKTELDHEFRNVLDRYLEGSGYELVSFIVSLFDAYPGADPYNHPVD